MESRTTQPFKVTSTQYVPPVETPIVAVLAPVLHVYVDPATTAPIVVACPAQIGTSGPSSTVCNVWCVSVKLSDVVQPFTVTATV